MSEGVGSFAGVKRHDSGRGGSPTRRGARTFDARASPPAVAERGRRAARGAGRRPGRRLRVRDRGRHALAVRVPPVRRLADHAPRLHEPRRGAWPPARSRSRRSAAARCARRATRSRSSGPACSRPSGRTSPPGTLQDYATQGRKRLLPWFGELQARGRSTRTASAPGSREMAELVDDGELSAKTVNNARTCLSMTLGEAVRRRPHRAEPVPVRARAAGRADRDRLPAARARSSATSTPASSTTGRSPSS